MPQEQARPGNRRFYRRIRSDQWQDEDRQSLQQTAFTLKADEAGLSVFDADIATPQRVLAHQLTLWTEIAGRSEKDRIWVGKQWTKHGDSVEALLDHGWGVVEILEETFRRCGFSPSDQIDADGHLEILGTKDAFEEQSFEIIADCRILSADECRL